ncbi:hypothetical protein [Sporosarcina sp. P13]|uniref:hypothetical protein n=1 Tax=Sporosarcina sp. P13 TaxID=2048263 RepID=UPI001304449F|nr:hypothetical protein [Sporosarcina sp. P13]
MRQRGALPFWLIAGAIRQRRSGFSDDHFTTYRSIVKCLEITEFLTNFNVLCDFFS